MSADLIPFDYAGQQVRTVLVDGEPWFVLADLCSVLGLVRSASAVAERLDDGVRRTYPIVDSLGRIQQATVVSEPGMYEVVIRSDKPEAVAFRRWITHEVIPAIRKTGAYVQVEEPREVQVARALIASAEIIKEQSAQIEQLTPSAEAWDALAADSDRDLSVREAAQVLCRDGISIGQNRLFVVLRDIHWIDQHNAPYQQHVDNGRLVRKITDYTDDYGQRFVKVQPRITVKGLAAIRTHLSKPGPDLRVVTA